MANGGKIISQMELEVDPQQSIQVRLSSSHSGDRIAKGMVFHLQFFDSNDKEVKEGLVNFSSSQNYKNYKYVFTGTGEVPHSEYVSVLPPASSIRLVMTLVQWAYLTEPKGEIIVVRSDQKSVVELSKGPFERFIACNQYWNYSFRFSLTNSKKISGRIALLLIRYFDDDHTVLTPRIKEQLSWSERFKSYSKYLASRSSDDKKEFEHILSPPENTKFMEIKVVEWNNSAAEFQCTSPVESSLQWGHTNKAGLLNETMVSHLAHSISLEKKTELASHVSAKQHHELLYESHIQTGNLPSALSTAEAEASERPSKRALHRLNFISQLIQSLDVNWAPTLSSSNRLNQQPKREKILHLFKVTYPFESTGGSIRNINIVESQKNAGIEPVVVTPLNYPRIFGVTDFKLVESIRGVRHIRFDLGSNAFQSASYICDNLQINTQLLAGLVRKESPAVIHAASGYKGYELASMAKVLSDHFSIPWIYEVRSFHEHTWTKDIFHANTSWHTKQRIIKENSLMLQANHVVTISHSMKDALIERGIPSDKITVVPNAVDVNSFSPGPKNKKLQKKLDLTSKKVLGYISNISKREGHGVLIKSLPIILKKHPNVVILIVGDGPEKEKMMALANQLGVEENVYFTGKVDHSEIQDYYRLIDLFIVPRTRDYASDLVTPLKPYEAMALEIPLIVSDRKALLEIIGNDRGYSFKTEDSKGLAEVVCKCLANLSECKKRASAARAWLIENRTWEQNARLYRDLYSQLTMGAKNFD